jgi:hypothetical protein
MHKQRKWLKLAAGVRGGTHFRSDLPSPTPSVVTSMLPLLYTMLPAKHDAEHLPPLQQDKRSLFDTVHMGIMEPLAYTWKALNDGLK